MFKRSVYKVLQISMAALLVFALAFGMSGVQGVQAQEALSEGCAQLAFFSQFPLVDYHGLGLAPFTFFAGETVSVTAGEPSTGDPQTVSIIDNVVVATASFPGTASYTIPSDGVINNLTFTLDRGSATMTVNCTAAANSTPQSGPGFVVNASTDMDDGSCDDFLAGVANCTLREAINAANAITGANTITFDIPAGDSGCSAANVCTITLGATLPAISDADGLTIDGSGADVTISGNNAVPVNHAPVMSVSPGRALTLNALTIAAGNNTCASVPPACTPTGGGIKNDGTLTITDTTFSNNSAGAGGGIWNAGTLEVTNSTFSGNSAGVGGGIYNGGGMVTVKDSTFSGNSSSQGGGAINNAGTLTVNNSTFSNNNATSGPVPNTPIGGGGIRNSGTLTVLDSIFSGNHTGFSGGGIFSSGSLTVTSSNFSGNTADVEGGGFRASGATVTDSTFTNNSGAIGGGIFAQPFGGALSVTDSIISGNTGSGIYNNGADNVFVTNSTISNNTGDGINNQGGLTVMNSTFSNNNGNGILSGIDLVVTNSSFSNNNRGIYGGNGALDLTNSTFSTNGEGIRWQGGLSLRNTISANSTSGADCFASFMLVNVRNLIEDGSCSPALSGDPMLDALADNGGPTQTMALQTGSPAIDAGDDATCAAAPVNNLDQRGVTRPIDGDTIPGAVCDIGAYEASDPAPSVAINQASGQADPTTVSPINFTVVFSESVTGFDGADVDLSASTAAGTLSALVTGGPSTYNVAVSGMTSAGDVVASIPANAATDGGSNGNTASTSTDNTVTYVTSSPTTLLYNGGQVAGIVSSFQAGARLSSPSAACVSGQTISFSLDVNPLNGSAGPYSLGSATTNSTGQATLTVSTTGWQEGIYIITASFGGTTSCDPSSDSAVLTAAAPGNSATGGGWYTLSGSGRVNFGFNIRKVDNKCTSNCAYKGHLLLMNNGKWKLKGTLNSYVKSSSGVGTAGGTGDLYWWDASLNGGLGDWALAKSGVTYTISFYDGGSGKKAKVDTFGISIKYTPVSPQPGSLPNSGLTPLKGGDIKVQ